MKNKKLVKKLVKLQKKEAEAAAEAIIRITKRAPAGVA